MLSLRDHLFRRNKRLPVLSIHTPISPAAAAAPSTIPAFEAGVSAAVSIFTPRPVLGDAEVVGVGDAVAAAKGVGEAVGVVEAEGEAVAQPGIVKTLVSSATCPFRASALPWTVVPVVAVMEVRARMLPLNVEAMPRVAELPTCQ